MTLSEALGKGKTLAFFSLVYVLAIITYWFKPWGVQNDLAQTIVYLLAPVLATGSALFLLAKYGLTGKRSLVFFTLLAGLIFLLAGEVIYVYFDYFLESRPFPTVADVFYLLSYPFIFLSIFIASRLLRESARSLSWQSRISLLVLFLLFGGVVAYSDIYLSYSTSESILVNAINLAYGLGDFLIIAGALGLFYLARHARQTAENYLWTGLVVGFGCITAADLLFANFNELYLSGNTIAVNIMDSLWMLGYTVIAFFIMNFVVKSIQTND